jgi:orotate phosphoribosyltransferase
VALSEDVVTTGHQVLAAAKVLEAQGAIVEIIVVALDRGGADTLRDAGYKVEAVASLRPTG